MARSEGIERCRVDVTPRDSEQIQHVEHGLHDRRTDAEPGRAGFSVSDAVQRLFGGNLHLLKERKDSPRCHVDQAFRQVNGAVVPESCENRLVIPFR